MLWVVYVKDENGKLHWWAKCDDKSTAIAIGEAAMDEYDEVKGYAVTEVIGYDG